MLDFYQWLFLGIAGRKFKKFNKVKVLRTLDVLALQQPATHPTDSQALAQRLSFSPNQEIQYVPPLVSILQGIEPEVVYAGYDNTQPETPSALLTGLNQLCERQLLCVVKWSKSLPGNWIGHYWVCKYTLGPLSSNKPSVIRSSDQKALVFLIVTRYPWGIRPFDKLLSKLG